MGKSWISPDAARAPRLLFESDAGNDVVYVFSLPLLKLVGMFGAFVEPQGECLDASGDIWITSTLSSQIFKYSRTGAPLATLDDPVGYPVGCAVNTSNNDLAVMNIMNFDYEPGVILVYKNSSGTPTVLTNPKVTAYYFATYDDSGNLYSTGNGESASYTLSECTSASGICNTIPLSGHALFYPGFIQWFSRGHYFVLGDQRCGGQAASCIYRVNVAGSKGTIVGSTTLINWGGTPACDVVQADIINDGKGKKYAVGSDYEWCHNTLSSSDRWAYPFGGRPLNTDYSSGLSAPIGAVISTKPN
jgi:hypothetical protein